MIVVRMVFQAKWGKAGEAAQEFRENAKTWKKVMGSNVRTRILTDLSGQFDTLVQEVEVESLAEWERLRGILFSSPEFQEVQERRGETPFVSGRTEFYTLEAVI